MKVGLDLGSATLRLAEERRGVILRQACVIADGLAGGPRYVVGDGAARMVGRTPAHLQTMTPLARGAVGAPMAAAELLRELVPKALGWRGRWRLQVVAAVPARLTENEESALRRALRWAGMPQVTLVAKPVAAALGAATSTGRQRCALVLDVGAETSEAAALAPGIVVSESLPLGGRELDRALQTHLRQVHGLEIALGQAERLKIAGCSAHPQGDGSRTEVFGRELDSGLPASLMVTGQELREAIAHPLRCLVDLVQRILDRTPPGLSDDLLTHGLVLTGGAAQLTDLDLFLAEQTGLKVRLAENPADCAVLGLLKTMETFEEPAREES